MRKKDLGDKLILIVQEEYEKLENSSFKTIRKYAKEFDEEMDTNPYFNVSVCECAAFALGFERFKKEILK